jgi:hypothetical protein
VAGIGTASSLATYLTSLVSSEYSLLVPRQNIARLIHQVRKRLQCEHVLGPDVLISASKQTRCTLVEGDEGEVCGLGKAKVHAVRRQVRPAIVFENIGLPACGICMHLMTLLRVMPTHMRQVSESFESPETRARLTVQSVGPAVRLPICLAMLRDETVMLLLHARHVLIAKRLPTKRLAAFLIFLRVVVPRDPGVLEEAVG